MQDNRSRSRNNRREMKVAKAPKDLVFSYTDAKMLRHYMTEQGYILQRAKTGLSQKQQKRLTKAVKYARHLALLPFTQTL